MRRRFFNAADNFMGGCYNKLSNEDIKRLGGKRPYVCQFNKIHIHIGPVLKDNDSDESYVMFKRGDVKSAQCYVLRSCSMLHLLTYYFAIKLSQSVDG